MATTGRKFKVQGRPYRDPQSAPDWQKEVAQRAQRVGQELGDGLVGVAEAAAGAVTEVLDLGIGVIRALLGR